MWNKNLGNELPKISPKGSGYKARGEFPEGINKNES